MRSRFRKPQSREDIVMFSRPDDWVAHDNGVRIIDIAVEAFLADPHTNISFAKGNSRRGRPAFSPATMLKLWLYGWRNGIESSHRLAVEARRNIEIIFLLGNLQPSQHSISDFRSANRGLIHELFLFLRRFTPARLAALQTEDTPLGESARKVDESIVKKEIAKLAALDEEVLMKRADEEQKGRLSTLWDSEIDRLKEQIKKLKKQKQRLRDKLKAKK